MRNSIKITLFLSLAANVVLGLWFLIQRDRALRLHNDLAYTEAFMRGATEQVAEGNATMEKVVDMLRAQSYRTIASTDQLDAFLAERGRHVQ